MSAERTARPVADAADPQDAGALRTGAATTRATPPASAAPIALETEDGSVCAAVMIETARIQGDQLEITGWMVGHVEFDVTEADVRCTHRTRRHSRADVARAIGIVETAPGFGFRSAVEISTGDRIAMQLRAHDAAGAVLARRALPLVCERAGLIPEERAFVMPPFFIESALASALTDQAILIGWCITQDDMELLLEGAHGTHDFLFDAQRLFRPDVWRLHGRAYGAGAARAGFIARLRGVRPGDRLSLVAEVDGVRHRVREVIFEGLPEGPLAAAEALFGAFGPDSDFAGRVAQIDAPILNPLIEHQVSTWAALPVRVQRYGPETSPKRSSLVIPLYGRMDFVEHQLAEFVRDPWLLEHAELIYVLDDPELVEPFSREAVTLHRLYGVAFSCVWGGVNRGFAGANNLGAQVAKGRHLVFLNSDVFPQRPGWLREMLSVLDAHESVGVVGPRLLFADGSIQHAGMRFVRDTAFGVWTNQHPCAGLEPSLDPAQQMTEVPAVTGACLAIRREDFDAVGGWDTGYLIGDFEDSDLCLKVRASGKTIAYLPTVQLTHLERQSMNLVGEPGFRQRVVLYNAVRHQDRWQHVLDSEPQAGGN